MAEIYWTHALEYREGEGFREGEVIKLVQFLTLKDRMRLYVASDGVTVQAIHTCIQDQPHSSLFVFHHSIPLV